VWISVSWHTGIVKILVTNDDGIESPGLHYLAEELSQHGDVIVFAPSSEYSGAGTAIGHIGGGVPSVAKMQRPEMPNAEAVYTVDGPPALAALLACRGAFGFMPDLVASGINPGWNVGLAVHHSGTVGAAITAHSLGVPALAVSQHSVPSDNGQQWAVAARAAASLLDEAFAHRWPLNINVPNTGADDDLEVVWTVPSDRVPWGFHNTELVEVADGRFQIKYEHHGPYTNHERTDTYAVEANRISVTPIVTSVAASTAGLAGDK